MNKLHIGYHKTGTTFLQKLIFPNVPNYMGRYYGQKEHTHIELYGDIDLYQGSENILKKYSAMEDIFISNEIFTEIKPKQLFAQLAKYSFDVLVVTRDLHSLLESRRHHPLKTFYLMDKIKNGIIDNEVQLHYSVDNLKQEIKNLTVLEYEKLFAGDLFELSRLSEFLCCDVSNIFLKNKHIKVNRRHSRR